MADSHVVAAVAVGGERVTGPAVVSRVAAVEAAAFGIAVELPPLPLPLPPPPLPLSTSSVPRPLPRSPEAPYGGAPFAAGVVAGNMVAPWVAVLPGAPGVVSGEMVVSTRREGCMPQGLLFLFLAHSIWWWQFVPSYLDLRTHLSRGFSRLPPLLYLPQGHARQSLSFGSSSNPALHQAQWVLSVRSAWSPAKPLSQSSVMFTQYE